MDIFTSLAVVVGVAAVGGIIARSLKQPAMLGYIVAGLGLAAVGWGFDREAVGLLGQFGVTLLLFLVGLELPISELKKSGQVALIVGVGQIVVTAILGFGLSRLLGFSAAAAVYLGIALTFSSTVLVVNLLAGKRDLHSLYGRIVMGYLLVQDFVAIGILAALSGLTLGGSWNWLNLGWIAIKGIAIVATALYLAENIIPSLTRRLASSTEVLFVAALGWCLVIAALMASRWVGFTVEIGGFIAGLTLANAAQSWQITARIRPLRDFFMTLFFVGLGAKITMADVGHLGWAAVAMSVFVLLGKPLVVMVVLALLGYGRRVAFLASLAVGQVSEFSLIILALALRVGQVDSEVLTLVGMVAVVTMTASTYLIAHANRIYHRVGKYLVWISLTGRHHTDLAQAANWQQHVILFGHNRTGSALKPALLALNKPLVVVDFDPQVVEQLNKQKLEGDQTILYGDMGDFDLYDEIALKKASLVVSTVEDINDNLQLLEYLHSGNKKRSVVVTAADGEEAQRLYKAGADYVLVPNSVGGEYLANLISSHSTKSNSIHKLGRKHWDYLRES
ncbi:MAG: cation:proton antiporter [bacterium]|nr:cation:proton antiporter [bacterium]